MRGRFTKKEKKKSSLDHSSSLTFSQLAASILTVADITVKGCAMNTMADVYKLFLLQEHGYFNFLSCHIKSVEHTSLFVKMGTQIAPGNN